MKNAIKIFKRDLKKIFTNSIAIVLVLGILVLPSLYAWFNIYANWDPYGKTGNMQVAVVNEDTGSKFKELEVDIGENIIENLKGNNSIDWQFVDKKTAIEGVEAGEYYAAIEIPKDFSKNITSIVTDEYKQPEIIYYANEKKNAIATKITDKVVQTVQLSVNSSFVTTVVNIMNQVLNTAIDIEESTGVSTFDYLKNEISSTQDTIASLQSSLESFKKLLDVAETLDSSLSKTDLDKTLKDTKSLIKNTEDTIEVTQNVTTSMVSTVGTIIDHSSSAISNVGNSLVSLSKKDYSEVSKDIKDTAQTVGTFKTEIDKIVDVLTKINAVLPSPNAKLTSLIKDLQGISTELGTISTSLDSVNVSNYTAVLKSSGEKLNNISDELNSAKGTYNKEIKPTLTKTISSLLATLGDLSNIIDALEKDAPQLGTMATALNGALGAGDDMISSIDGLLTNISKKLDSLYKNIDTLSNSEIVNSIINLTEGNADQLGSFLACPVNIQTDKVYGIENYGSAMAPFYSTLAFWVGAMFLAATVSTRIKKRKEISPDLKIKDAFFGRGMLYMGLAAIQSAIICLGDLYFLKIQCYHPLKFIFAGVLAGIVFSLFIFSLVFSFGDIGKAVGVILLVVQIGGSGGTFPIDVTPQFFISINPYLPFTFVIEALRECVCGTYGNDYWMYLLKLLAYAAIALVIGLPVKAMIKKPLQFFERRIEETDLF